MTWLDHHKRSEEFAAIAHNARRAGHRPEAEALFRSAAAEEIQALNFLSLTDKPRTFGITAVSAVALAYKARDLQQAEHLAHGLLSNPLLPGFAVDQLRELLQVIWNEQVQIAAGIEFAPAQVTIAVDGGEVVRGGAPLDLVLERVQTVQSLFYRTAELLKQLPLRRQGPATKSIQELCRPWLFQSVPGSYQFTVAIQGKAQPDLFGRDDDIQPELVASTFMAILESAAAGPADALVAVVPDREYRQTFLKLARNLAPTGRTFTQMEIRSSQVEPPVLLTQESRKAMTRAIRGTLQDRPLAPKAEGVTLRGVLRAVHLDRDWLELVGADGASVQISDLVDTVDDVIGPMMNHHVVVQATRDAKGVYRFRDIEADEDASSIASPQGS